MMYRLNSLFLKLPISKNTVEKGGFSEDKKLILDKDINIVDLKGIEFKVILNHHGIYTQNARGGKREQII